MNQELFQSCYRNQALSLALYDHHRLFPFFPQRWFFPSTQVVSSFCWMLQGVLLGSLCAALSSLVLSVDTSSLSFLGLTVQAPQRAGCTLPQASLAVQWTGNSIKTASWGLHKVHPSWVPFLRDYNPSLSLVQCFETHCFTYNLPVCFKGKGKSDLHYSILKKQQSYSSIFKYSVKWFGEYHITMFMESLTLYY